MKNYLDLNLKLKQSLKLTPQMIQSINLLQLSNLDLLTHIDKEVSENPLLEAESPSNIVDVDATLFNSGDSPDYEWVEYMEDSSDLGVPSERGNDDSKRQFLEGALSGSEDSLYEHLDRQLRIAADDEDTINIGERILSYLNKDGYFTVTTEVIAEEMRISAERVEDVLSLIQTFEPCGVAGRDLSEVILLQLASLDHRSYLAEVIASSHLKDVSSRNYDKIAKELGVSNEEIEEAISIITGCEPYPGRQFDNTQIKYVVPDIRIEKTDGEWKVVLIDEFLPKLKISKHYSKILKKPDDKDLNKYLTDKMGSAVTLIHAIEQRRRTMYKVGHALIELQKNFFEHGKEHLRPLILKDVAEYIQMSESTVSRISNNKYLQTVWGIFPIKYFFSVSVKSDSGTASKQSVKEIMKKIITESEKNLSDEKIRGILEEKGIKIARRTVAKYRKELKIFSSRER